MPTSADDDHVIGLPKPEHEAILRRVLERLTGTVPQEVMIGRYRLVRRLGVGGMGVVYLVRDPDLDRLVALKVLHADLDADELFERRMRREARALARLDHPHVVRVHEVGEHEGRTYLVMEHVEGTTLTAWLDDGPRRPWEEIVRTFVAAGEGLAAAHAAGLAHCDFKPDNVLIGDDGAIKVGDFGLVRAVEDVPEARITKPVVRLVGSGMTTREGEVYGTPAFMAPEQLEGKRGDSHSDQFSFCVALYEALCEQAPFAGPPSARRESIAAGPMPMSATVGPVPARLVRAIVRGLHADRERRWPSMDALLAELRHALGAKARRRRRWIVGAMATMVLGLVATKAHERYERRAQAQACAVEGAEIDELWNDQARAAVREGLMATQSSRAAITSDKVMPWIDRHAQAWRRDRTQACRSATLEGRLDNASLDKARWCLDVRRQELSALLEALRDADEQTVDEAVPAVGRLPPTGPCVDAVVLAGLPEPPLPAERDAIVELQESLARVRALEFTGRYRPGLELVEDVLARAEALGWLPLVASAHGLRGVMLQRTGDYEEALAAEAQAFTDASRARAWGIAATAASEATFVAGSRLGRYEEARVWSRSSEAAEVLASDPLGLRRADRLDDLGAAENAAGHHAEAERLHEEALGIRERALGTDGMFLAWGFMNLGNVKRAQGDLDRARALYERALAIYREALGAEHPKVAGPLNNIAVVLTIQGKHQQAQERFAEVLALRRSTLGPLHHQVATAALNLAATHERQGHLDEAIRLTEDALSVLDQTVGPEHRDVAKALSNLAAYYDDQGDVARAIATHERAVALLERAVGTEHPDVGRALFLLAMARLAGDDLEGARETFERSSLIQERAHGPEHPERAKPWLGLAKVALARSTPTCSADDDALRRSSGR